MRAARWCCAEYEALGVHKLAYVMNNVTAIGEMGVVDLCPRDKGGHDQIGIMPP